VVYESGLYSSVSIELDCKLVIDDILGRLSYRREFNACKTSMHSLPNFRVNFVKKQANNVDHLLARAALSYANRQVFDYITSYIMTILMNEKVKL